MKVKLKQQKAEGPPSDDANRGGGGGRGGGTDDRSASPDHERDRDSEEDADGEADTQHSGSAADSDSDPFEDAETGRKRPPRGPPAGAEDRGYGGRREAGANETGVGRNKRLHTDERKLDEQDS